MFKECSTFIKEYSQLETVGLPPDYAHKFENLQAVLIEGYRDFDCFYNWFTKIMCNLKPIYP